ncbi:hydroxyethylthiazole kinase [Clostridium perfringens]|nr:hydroxyethylthiazole kinase [Clostridium perfringens]
MEVLKRENPLIHMITNYVTVNDLAQVTINYGGLPLMATHHDELKEITKMANGLLVNIGTLEPYQMESSMISIKIAKEKGIPSVLDPVGVQASKLRKDFAKKLILEGEPSLIKGNLVEIKNLIGETSNSIGIDSFDDSLSENTKNKIKEYARERNLIVVVSGVVDFITNGEESASVKNGTYKMSKITGTGCMLGALLTLALSFYDHKDLRFKEVVKAVSTWGICGELGEERLREKEGLMTFKHNLLDELSIINDETIKEREKVIYD